MTTLPTPTPDVISLLAGISTGSPLGDVRAARPQAREQAQRSFAALFEPASPDAVTLRERYALATFIAGLHGDPAVAAFYGARLAAHGSDLADAVAGEIGRGLTEGPYGTYPEGRLATESVAGPRYQVSEEGQTTLGHRLTAAFEHVHLLVFHPRDAKPEALAALLAAGWTTDGIVTLSQLAAFLSFQIRAVIGLRTLSISSHSPRH
ncbi:CMD domain protein [Telmatospirillum sp.]|uniref:CMD domain protein n=1 Tax=Telmatospirillum sp. TaxID=2079197 RepID=UPI00283C0F11|nr:CMD domain protein [Telmatospirillum sp.]MDR3437401.1 CMD domain protein [Telmatospirillum sp.]